MRIGKIVSKCVLILIFSLTTNPVILPKGSIILGENENNQPEMQWEHKIGGSFRDIAFDLIQTTDGGFALAGYTKTNPETVYKHVMYLVKTDSKGKEHWSQAYQGGEQKYYYEAHTLVETIDGGFALIGPYSEDPYSYPYRTGETGTWLGKMGPNGEPLWNQIYKGTSASTLLQTSDGGFAFAGTSEQMIWLVKTDQNGLMEWNQSYRGTDQINSDEISVSLIPTIDGGFALGGQRMVTFLDQNDISTRKHVLYLVKTDSEGEEIWNQTYQGTKSFSSTGIVFIYPGPYPEKKIEANCVIQTSDGDFVLAGGRRLVKTDQNGSLLWNKEVDGDAYSLIQTIDGGFAQAGNKGWDKAQKMWLEKTDENGVVQWNQIIDDDESEDWGDGAHALLQTSDGDYILAGFNRNIPSPGSGHVPDMWLVKVGYGSVETTRFELFPFIIGCLILTLWQKRKNY